MNKTSGVLLLCALVVAALALWCWPRVEGDASAVAVEGPATPLPESASRPAAPLGSGPSAPADPTASRESTVAQPVAWPAPGPTEIVGVVVHSDDTPVRGARITARPRASVDAEPSTPVEADTHGRFVCTGITPGPWYFLRAEAPGHVPLETGAVAGTGVRFVLKAGGSLRGTVTDADHKPVAGARLLVRHDVGTDPITGKPRTETVGTTATGRRGEYQIGPIPIGGGQLLVLAADAVPEARTLQVSEPREHTLDIELKRLLPLRCEVRDAVSQVPVAGAEVFGAGVSAGLPEPLARSDADGRLLLRVPQDVPTVLLVKAPGFAPMEHHLVADSRDSETVLTLLVARGARIAGVVQDAAGAPVAGARLLVEELPLSAARREDRARLTRPLMPKVSASSVFTGQPAEPETRSDAAGRFEIGGLLGPDGVVQIRVCASREGFCDAWSEAIGLDLPRQEALVAVTMMRGGILEGRLTWQGRPTPGWVSASVGSYGVNCEASDAGVFVLPPLPAGVASVSASVRDAGARGLAPRQMEATVTEGGRTRIEIEAGPGAPPSLPELSGVVKDANGRPAQGVLVLCSREVQPSGFRFANGVASGADGRWRFPVARSADGGIPLYTVSVRVDGIERRHEHVSAPRDDLDFELARTVSLTVEFRCAGGGTPRSVSLWVREASGSSWQRCRKQLDGPHFTTAFDAVDRLKLPAGEYDFRARAQDNALAELLKVRVTGAGDPPLRFELQTGVSVALEPSGDVEALPHRSVGLVHADEALPEGSLGENGFLHRAAEGARVQFAYLIKGRLMASSVAPGRYRLLSEDRDLAFDPEWIDVGDTPTTGRVRVTLRR